MPNVDFYLLNTLDQKEMYRFLCRLVDKAYQQQLTACLYTSSLEEAHYLDDLLWTFRDISFIPHQIGENASTLLPLSITITTDQPTLVHNDILFNLTQGVQPFFLQFSRIIETVSAEKTKKMKARKRYGYYKEQSCTLTTHNISLPC